MREKKVGEPLSFRGSKFGFEFRFKDKFRPYTIVVKNQESKISKISKYSWNNVFYILQNIDYWTGLRIQFVKM